MPREVRHRVGFLNPLAFSTTRRIIASVSRVEELRQRASTLSLSEKVELAAELLESLPPFWMTSMKAWPKHGGEMRRSNAIRRSRLPGSRSAADSEGEAALSPR